jgi:hypothetical protein
MCAFAFDTKIKANAADTEPNYKHTSYLRIWQQKETNSSGRIGARRVLNETRYGARGSLNSAIMLLMLPCASVCVLNVFTAAQEVQC